MLAVGHADKEDDKSINSHAKAEMLTPDGKWNPVDDYPYGMCIDE